MAIFLKIPFPFSHSILGFKLSPLPSALYQYPFSFPPFVWPSSFFPSPSFFFHSCIQNTKPSCQFLEFSYPICPTYITRPPICGSGRDMKQVIPTFDTEGRVREKRRVILLQKYFLSSLHLSVYYFFLHCFFSLKEHTHIYWTRCFSYCPIILLLSSWKDGTYLLLHFSHSIYSSTHCNIASALTCLLKFLQGHQMVRKLLHSLLFSTSRTSSHFSLFLLLHNWQNDPAMDLIFSNGTCFSLFLLASSASRKLAQIPQEELRA